ncbi:MAG: hypothetical protein AB7R69_00080 [Candidatus Babeliales bacterium]
MKFFKKDAPFGSHEKNENRTILSKVHERVGHLRRKLSRGAANIFRMIKSRNHWGNKQLWGSHEKGRNKSGHKPPK